MLRSIRVGSFCLALLSCVLFVPGALRAEVAGSHSARSIITSNIAGSRPTALKAPWLHVPAGAVDQGRIASEKVLSLQLVMKRSPEQQAALDKFIEQTRTPGNPLYAQTITPAEFIETFGVADHDINALRDWLAGNGFKVVRVMPVQDRIAFTGSVSQVESVFGTEIHNYRLANGTVAFANASPIKVPGAAAAAIRSIEGMQNIFNVHYISSAPVSTPRRAGAVSAVDTNKPERDLNPGWKSAGGGSTELHSMREGRVRQVNPDLYQPTNMTLTATAITGTTPTFANGVTSTVTSVMTWTQAGTPTGTITFFDTDGALNVTANLTSAACTLTNATTYTCTYAWTAATGAFHVSPDTVTAYYGGDATYGETSGDANITLTYSTGEFFDTYDFTGSRYTWPEGTSPAVTLTFDLDAAFFDPPTGNMMFWGTGYMDQIHEFTSIQTASVCTTFEVLGEVECVNTYNPPTTLLPGVYSIYGAYSGDTPAKSDSTSASGLAMSEFVITATGTTATTTTVTANPATVNAGGGTTFTTTTKWTAAGNAPTGSVGITQVGEAPLGYPSFGQAVFPTAPATTSSGFGSYFYGEYTYQYSCTTSVSAKTVVCSITDSDVADLLDNQPGANTLTATYTGDTTYKSSSGNVTVTYADTNSYTSATTLAANNTTPAPGDTVAYTVVITTGTADKAAGSPTPIGTVAIASPAITASPITGTISGCVASGTARTQTYTCTINQNGVVPATLRAGSYTVTATYSGDTNYEGSTASLTLLVSGTIVTTSSVTANPTTVSSTTPSTTLTDVISFAAQTVPPSGTIALTCATGSAGTCTNLPAPISLSSCTITSTTATCTMTYALDTYDSVYGNYNLKMTYSGDDNYKASSGTAVVTDALVGTDVSTTAVVAAPTTVVYGAGTTVTYTATVNGAANNTQPTGTVTFSGTPIGMSAILGTIAAGNCTRTGTGGTRVYHCTVASPATAVPVATPVSAGYTITAHYNGDTNYAGSTGTTTLPVTLATPTVSVQSLTDFYGDTVTLQAAETGKTGAADPTGTPTFKVNGVTVTGTPACTPGTSPTVNQVCSINYQLPATLLAGSYTISVTFAADTNYATATGTGMLTVNANATATAIAANPTAISGVGTTTLTATVTNTSVPTGGAVPTGGTVTFTDTTNAATLGTCTLSAGTCSAVANGSAMAGGANAIKASYGGVTGEFLASVSATTPVTVGADTTSTSVVANPNSINGAQTSTVTATVSDTTSPATNPTGTVTFTDTTNSAALGTCSLSAGSCSVMVPGTSLVSGANTIQASYAGVANSFTASSGTTTLTLSGPPPCSGNALCFTSVSHNFGQVQVGTAATAYTLAVSNHSTTTAYPFTLVFTPSKGFTTATNCPAMIAAGKSCELAFYFTPAATGPVSTTWSLATEGGFTYTPANGGLLQGSGTSQSGVSLTTNGHNFGTVAVGMTSPTYAAELSNSTTTPETIALGPVPAGPFHMVTNCTTKLAAGSSCEIEFTFTPTGSSPVSVVVPLSGTPAAIMSGGVALPNGGITLSGN